MRRALTLVSSVQSVWMKGATTSPQIIQPNIFVRTFSTASSQSTRRIFDSILQKTVRAEDHLSELLDKEEEKNVNPASQANVDEDDDTEWVEMFNPETGEWNGPRYGEPTKFGDWQNKGRTSDFK